METERLVLDHFSREDIPAIYGLAGDPAVAGPGGWPAFESLADAVYMYDNVLAAPDSFAIRLKEQLKTAEAALVGAVMIRRGRESNLDIGDSEGEIGFWIGKPYQGNGYGREAVVMALNYAVDEMGLKKVWAAYFEGNDGSAGLLRSCGFRYEYCMEDLWWLPTNDIRTEHVMSLDMRE